MGNGLSVESSVQDLIQQATDPSNLSVIYMGWSPFINCYADALYFFFVYRNTKSNVQSQCDDVPKNTIADSEATITAIPQMNRDKLKYLNIFMLVGTLHSCP